MICRVLAAGALLGLIIHAAPARADGVSLDVYGDVDGAMARAEGETSASFAAPVVDLFLSSDQDRLAFLVEVLFEAGDDNAFVLDVERLEVAYLVSELLRVRAGRFHTALGYYNDSHHHGAYFQLPIERPSFVAFEDEGGLIPAHAVGVTLDGRRRLGEAGALRYDLQLANGRGLIVDEIQNATDPNLFKAICLRLRLEPNFLDGLTLGLNGYVDRIPVSESHASLDEWIAGAHAAYVEGSVHLIGEGYFFRHRDRMTDATFDTWAGFAEAGYALGSWTPYLRYERVHFADPGDPFFGPTPSGELGSRHAGVGGLKWTVDDHLALKLEGSALHTDDGRDQIGAGAQAAFGF